MRRGGEAWRSGSQSVTDIVFKLDKILGGSQVTAICDGQKPIPPVFGVDHLRPDCDRLLSVVVHSER